MKRATAVDARLARVPYIPREKQWPQALATSPDLLSQGQIGLFVVDLVVLALRLGGVVRRGHRHMRNEWDICGHRRGDEAEDWTES